MPYLPPRAVRQLAPVFGRHHLGPGPIKLAVVALAETGIARPGAERRIEALAAEPHLVVDRHAARRDPTAGLGAFLPIIHVVLLEGAGRAETAYAGEAERLFDLARGRLVDEYPGPHLGPAGAARLPNPEGPRGAPQQREIREYGGDDRVDQPDARPEP